MDLRASSELGIANSDAAQMILDCPDSESEPDKNSGYYGKVTSLRIAYNEEKAYSKGLEMKLSEANSKIEGLEGQLASTLVR